MLCIVGYVCLTSRLLNTQTTKQKLALHKAGWSNPSFFLICMRSPVSHKSFLVSPNDWCIASHMHLFSYGRIPLQWHSPFLTLQSVSLFYLHLKCPAILLLAVGLSDISYDGGQCVCRCLRDTGWHSENKAAQSMSLMGWELWLIHHPLRSDTSPEWPSYDDPVMACCWGMVCYSKQPDNIIHIGGLEVTQHLLIGNRSYITPRRWMAQENTLLVMWCGRLHNTWSL